MSNIKALEELRELGEKVKNSGNTGVHWNDVLFLVDKIEAEIEWYEACNFKQRTLEDVLRECAEAYASGADVELGSTGEMFAKYADEIRELLGVDK